MALSEQMKNEIRLLSAEIGRNPEDTAALLERGKLYYRAGMFGPAANDFNSVAGIEPSNVEAGQYLLLIDEILAFRNTDLLNP